MIPQILLRYDPILSFIRLDISNTDIPVKLQVTLILLTFKRLHLFDSTIYQPLYGIWATMPALTSLVPITTSANVTTTLSPLHSTTSFHSSSQQKMKMAKWYDGFLNLWIYILDSSILPFASWTFKINPNEIFKPFQSSVWLRTMKEVQPTKVMWASIFLTHNIMDPIYFLCQMKVMNKKRNYLYN